VSKYSLDALARKLDRLQKDSRRSTEKPEEFFSNGYPPQRDIDTTSELGATTEAISLPSAILLPTKPRILRFVTTYVAARTGAGPITRTIGAALYQYQETFGDTDTAVNRLVSWTRLRDLGSFAVTLQINIIQAIIFDAREDLLLSSGGIYAISFYGPVSGAGIAKPSDGIGSIVAPGFISTDLITSAPQTITSITESTAPPCVLLMSSRMFRSIPRASGGSYQYEGL